MSRCSRWVDDGLVDYSEKEWWILGVYGLKEREILTA